jgi:small subunit ribosomal protein S3
MGRKVHPIGFRLGYIKDWQSRWFADRNFAELVNEDRMVREMVEAELSGASISRVEIERAANRVEITIHTAKPGVVIGKRGANVDVLRGKLEKLTGKKVKLNISEVHQPELDAQLVAESVGEQITKRVSFKRAQKQAIQRAIRSGAKGIMISCSGRLNGAEMSRTVKDMEGRIPRHTLRADIDYAVFHAHTTYGRIGVKVWIYKGDIFPGQERTAAAVEASAQQRTGAPRGRAGGEVPRGQGTGVRSRGGRRGGGHASQSMPVDQAPSEV